MYKTGLSAKNWKYSRFEIKIKLSEESSLWGRSGHKELHTNLIKNCRFKRNCSQCRLHWSWNNNWMLEMSEKPLWASHSQIHLNFFCCVHLTASLRQVQTCRLHAGWMIHNHQKTFPFAAATVALLYLSSLQSRWHSLNIGLQEPARKTRNQTEALCVWVTSTHPQTKRLPLQADWD